MSRNRITAVALALGIALSAAPAANAGGSGDFYKTDNCSPFLESRPQARVTNYDYGTGQQVHYSTDSRWPWYAHRVYAHNGSSLAVVKDGYYNWPYRSTILRTTHVWRNSVTGQTKSCTNVT